MENDFVQCFEATGVGSLPHQELEQACILIARNLPDTPFWPQLPRYSLLESMNLQASAGLPFLKVDETKGKMRFHGSLDEARELEKVYSSYLAGETESFRLPERYAGGFWRMMNYLEEKKISPRFFKGQMVGPITFGLSVQDERGKDIIHNEVIFDALVKGLLLRGRWIIEEMKKICPRVVFFIDEPALSGYGSAFFSVESRVVSQRLNEFIEDFQQQGARVGVHCCGNTDWSLLLESRADIINFDAWGFLERLALYPEALQGFLSRKGVLAWGIVPTTEFTGNETVESLEERLESGFRQLETRGLYSQILRERCLLTSSCGMGLMTVEDAEKAMRLLSGLSRRMREKYC